MSRRSRARLGGAPSVLEMLDPDGRPPQGRRVGAGVAPSVSGWAPFGPGWMTVALGIAVLAGCSAGWLLTGVIVGEWSALGLFDVNVGLLGGVIGGVVGSVVLRKRTQLRAMPPGGQPIAFLALIGGMFAPWLGGSYFAAGRVSAGVLDLPGGEVYVAGVAAFLLAAMYGGSRQPWRRAVPLVMAAGLAGYAGFWFLGQVTLAVNSGLTPTQLSFGVGSLFSFAGAVWSFLVVRTSARRAAGTGASGNDEYDLVLSSSGPQSEFASREAFLDRLETLLDGADERRTVPLVFLRVDGINAVRRRHGGPAADRILMTVAHRLRANVRHHDIVVRLVPAEVFVLLAGDIREEHVEVVVRRLTAGLAMPLPGVKRRHARGVTVTAAAVPARLADGRLKVTFGEEQLLDAPIRTDWLASELPGLIDCRPSPRPAGDT